MRSTLIGALFAMTVLVGPGMAQAGAKIDLKILYAGKSGSERERDFVQFLQEHFTEVTSADLSKFAAARAASVDVVLLDWDGSSEALFKSPRPDLGENYSRATLTIGIAGAFICDNRRLKIGYT